MTDPADAPADAEGLPAVVCVSLNASWDRTIEVPGLELGTHRRGRTVARQAAGKAVNVARLLDTLGTPCVLTGFVGRGDREPFAETFEGTAVRIELFEVRGPTRENVTLVDSANGRETHVRDEGTPPAAEDLERLDRKLGILASARSTVIFAGSLPPEVDAAAFGRLLDTCRRARARLAVDSSGDALAAVREDRRLWLVKPNRAELAEIVGRPVESDDDLRRAAEELRGHVDEVVVTAGADGAMLFTAEGVWRARPGFNPAEVVNTVGCGDALLAGYVRARAADDPPPEALRWGVAAGTAAVRRVAAGEVDPEDVRAIRERVDLAAVE
jgi:1-phosphofructokinase